MKRNGTNSSKQRSAPFATLLLRDGGKKPMYRAVLRYALVCACFAHVFDASASDIAIHSTVNSFADVKDRLIFAIENRGLVVSYTARVGTMLERTGGAIGSSRPIYANAEVIEFCSATLSRATMEADPHNIAYCPYSIAVYVLARERQRVYVVYRMLGTGSGVDASRRALRAVEELMADIVREALK